MLSFIVNVNKHPFFSCNFAILIIVYFRNSMNHFKCMKLSFRWICFTYLQVLSIKKGTHKANTQSFLIFTNPSALSVYLPTKYDKIKSNSWTGLYWCVITTDKRRKSDADLFMVSLQMRTPTTLYAKFPQFLMFRDMTFYYKAVDTK